MINGNYVNGSNAESNYSLDNSSTESSNINNLKDNYKLVVSEKNNSVYLPYRVSEIESYLSNYPEEYSSNEDVINKEFILPLSHFIHHSSMARFREAYSLCRDREAKPIIESMKYAFSLAFKSNLNPVIIAACRTQEQLYNYIECLDSNHLDNFKDFEILYEINPL